MNIFNGFEKNTPTDPRIGTKALTSGSGTIYLTDDGTASGNALLSSAPFPPMCWINSSANSYPAQGTISGDLKTLTINANQQGTTNTNALINLLGGLTSLVSGITYTSVPNGTVANYILIGAQLA